MILLTFADRYNVKAIDQFLSNITKFSALSYLNKNWNYTAFGFERKTLERAKKLKYMIPKYFASSNIDIQHIRCF